MNEIIGYNYDDIFLIPKYGIVSSRSKCDTSIKLGNKTFNLPVVPANMKAVVDIDTCKFLAKNNLFYIMHRFDIDTVKFCEEMLEENYYTSISVGVSKESRDVLTGLYNKNIIPDYITIDVAHGYSTQVFATMKIIRSLFPSTYLIVGNTVTAESISDFKLAGANAVKVGIANGKACTTKYVSGFSYPQFSAVLECAKEAARLNLKVIADGGIKDIGDFSKAMVAGADMIMAGSLFAGYNESAKSSKNSDGTFSYYGSASSQNKGNDINVEGKSLIIESKGEMTKLITKIGEGIRSGISYAGGTDLSAFKSVEWGVIHK